LAAAIITSLGVAAARGSWLALAPLAVVTAGVVYGLRRVILARRNLTIRYARLDRAVGAMALVGLDGTTDTSGPPSTLPVEAVPSAVHTLIERGDVLRAYALVSDRGCLEAIDYPNQYGLWRGLQQRGYLRDAMTVGQACVTDAAGRRALAQLRGELAVLSGDARPVAPAAPPDFEPVAGRVLHMVGTALPTTQAGFTLRTHYTCVAQATVGLDPHVVTHMGYADALFRRRKSCVDGVTYHRVSGPPRGSLPLDRWLTMHLTRVGKLVAALRPAILHAASDYINALTARALGDAFKIPVVYESRGFWEETWLSRQATQHGWDLARLEHDHGLPDTYLLRRALEDRCRREADWVITLADVMADRIAAGAVDRGRITVIPNAVDVDAFPVLTRNPEVAARLGIADDTTVIGYISSLLEYEGIDTLISAYATVKDTSPTPVALLIVGDGPERLRLMQQAAAAGLDDVIFTGRVAHDAVLDYYSLIDIFVVPRKSVEVCHLVTPLKPFEAFSTGRTVVMSNVRALSEIAANSNAAELFEAGDADSLAKTLVSLLQDPSHRNDLATTGAAWVRSHRTWTANARAYLSIYAALGAAEPSPGGADAAPRG
jgi:glycosyltransferase involved in cell wall biosynthesis